jgi:regulator of nonsense transcripts 1
MQNRLNQGIIAEQEEQGNRIKHLYERSSIRGLQAEGAVLVNLQATQNGRRYSDFLFQLTCSNYNKGGGGGGRRQQLPFHKFSRGDFVLLSWNTDPSSSSQGTIGEERGNKKKNMTVDFVQGIISNISLDKIQLALSKDLAETVLGTETMRTGGRAAGGFRLDRGFPDVTTERQLEAVGRLAMDGIFSAAEERVRNIILGHPDARKLAAEQPGWTYNKEKRVQAAKLLKELSSGLNESQRKAINHALTNSFSLWIGPPGAGKTRTLLSLIELLCSLGRAESSSSSSYGSDSGSNKQRPILATANTNAAVDNIVEGLLERGIRVVRIGQPTKLRADLQQACIENLIEQSPEGRLASRMRDESQELIRKYHALKLQQQGLSDSNSSSCISSVSYCDDDDSGRGNARSTNNNNNIKNVENLRRRADDLWKEANLMCLQISREILREAEVVVTTCTASVDRHIARMEFKLVLVDEAAQATEPATLIPLLRGGVQQVVMVGDPNQLPATVTSLAAKKLGLDVPMFQRLWMNCRLEVMLLDTQYRMHPGICDFPSKKFYNGRLKTGIDKRARPLVEGIQWLSPLFPVLFVDSADDGERQDKRREAKSYYNPDEAQIVVDMLMQVIQEPAAEKRGSSADIAASDDDNNINKKNGVSSSSSSSTRGPLSVAVLSPYNGQVLEINRLLARDCPELLQGKYDVSVETIDSFQGREADLIILTTVRSNDKGTLGFVKDARRMNVAITRAKRGLVVVGNAKTLQYDEKVWGQWLTYYKLWELKLKEREMNMQRE